MIAEILNDEIFGGAVGEFSDLVLFDSDGPEQEANACFSKRMFGQLMAHLFIQTGNLPSAEQRQLGAIPFDCYSDLPATSNIEEMGSPLACNITQFDSSRSG